VKPVEESRSAEKSSFFDRALQTLKTPPSKWDFGKGKKEEAVEAKDVKGKQSEGKESKKAVNFHSPGY